MALQLGDYVLAGELINTRPNVTHGWVMIRGWEQPLRFELMGNPEADLAGRRLYFEISRQVYGGVEQKDGNTLNLEDRQFGATGLMTAHHLVRVFHCGREEFLHRSKLGEPPPTEWKRRLYLEWFGNSGAIAIDLADPLMYFIERDGNQEVSVPLDPPEEPPFDANDPPSGSDPKVLQVRPDVAWGLASMDPSPLAEEEGFDLFSEELTRYLDENFARPEENPVAAEVDNEEDAIWADLELMDALIERGGGMEMGELIGRSPDWQFLTEEKAEVLLKVLVARLATYRIAFDVCEHCSMREAYRILVEELAHEGRVHPELGQSSWVSHFSTSDSCEACQAEAEADFGGLGDPEDNE